MHEHPDYEKGDPLKHISIAMDEPTPGDTVVTAVFFEVLYVFFK